MEHGAKMVNSSTLKDEEHKKEILRHGHQNKHTKEVHLRKKKQGELVLLISFQTTETCKKRLQRNKQAILT